MTGAFTSAFAAWQAALADRQRSPRTREEYGRFVQKVQREVCDLLGDPTVVAPALERWSKGLRDKALAPATVRSYICAVRSFFGYLVEAHLVAVNPAAALRIPAVPATTPRPIETKAVDAVFSVLDPSTMDGLRDLAMVWLYYSSLRLSEVTALTTANVSYKPEEAGLVLTFRGKRRRDRLVVLRAEASVALGWYLLQRFAQSTHEAWLHAAYEQVRSTAASDEAARYLALLHAVDRVLAGPLATAPLRIFVRDDGEPFTKRDANRQFAKYRALAGLGERDSTGARIAPHGLRHTVATALLNNGVDIRVVQDILGHASIRQTEGYTKVLTSTKGRAIQQQPVPKGSTMDPKWI